MYELIWQNNRNFNVHHQRNGFKLNQIEIPFSKLQFSWECY